MACLRYARKYAIDTNKILKLILILELRNPFFLFKCNPFSVCISNLTAQDICMWL